MKTAEAVKPEMSNRLAITWLVIGLLIAGLGMCLGNGKIVRWGGTWREVVISVGGFMMFTGTYWIIKNFCLSNC